jgi:fibronectin-binding autotransporter adhesin
MRPTSSLAVKWMSVLSVVLAIFALANLASAQSGTSSKKKLSGLAQQQSPVTTTAKPALKVHPEVTTDTWTGGGGSGDTDWGDASNWSGGAIVSGDNIAISLGTAATTVGANESFTIGTLSLANTGDSVTMANNTTLIVGGNISNAGTITVNAAGNTTGLNLSTSLTLSGGGTIDLTTTNDQYSGYLYGTSGSVLTTSSNIAGAGVVGDGDLNFVNSGTINANISGQTLTVNPDTCTGCTNTNTGTLEATGGGTLTLANGTWTQTGAGKITAGTGSTVFLTDDVSITGGTLSTSGSGVIYNAANTNVFLTNVTNTGNYTLQNNTATEINGTLTNTGTITLDAAGNTTELYLTGNTTLSGSGTVVMTSTNNEWTAYFNGAGGSVLTNESTITGWGTIGNGALGIVNASNGVINSNISGGNILVNPDVSLTSSNAGLMEATNGGTLTLSNGTWTNTGTIQAAAGSSVVLQSNVSITGGTLESTGSGVVIGAANNDVFLTGLTLAGTYDLQNNSATEINGTITNNGVINLQSTGNLTELYVTTAGTGTATLAGSGSIVLGTGSDNALNGAGGTSLIIDQNVSGVGNIGEGNLTLTNNSTINANISPTVSTAPLYIQAGAGGMANNATLEATNGGNLTLYGGTITNASGGIIEAVGSDSSGNASTVVLTANTTVSGGTLTTTGAGVIEVAANNIANLTNLTNTGTLNVLNNAQIDATGTITNNGTITLEAAGNQTYFYAATPTVLTGTGTLVLSSSNDQYTGNVDGPGGLTNDETITGAGLIDSGTFTNNGTINANVSGQTLLLQSLTAGVNTKTMEASGGGTMEFNGSSWNNAGGTITAQTGSAVDLTGGTSITGGTLTSAGTGQVYVAANNTVYLTGLTTGGALNVQNNGEISASGTITNNGTITLQAAGNQTYLYAGAATTLTGTGTLVMSSTNNQYTANLDGANGFTNDETITGAGTIDSGVFVNNGTINANTSGQTLTLQSFTTATNTKTMEASGGGTLELNGSTWTNTNATIEAETGSTVNLTNSATINGGTLTTSGTGVINVLANNYVYLSGVTNSGTLNVQNNTQLSLTGAITNTGTVTLQATGNATYLIINGAVTLNGSGTIDMTSLNGQYTNQIYGVGTGPVLVSHNTIEGAGNLGSGNMGFTNDGTVDANISGQTIAINVNSSGFTNYNGTTTTLTGGTYIANGGNITFAAGNTTGITTLAASVTEEGGGQILNTSNGNANALANLTSITSAGSLTTDVNFTDAGAFSNAGSLTILGGTTFQVGSLTQISGGSLTAGTYVLDSNLDITGAAQTITTNAANLTLAGGTIENTSNSTNALAGLAANTGKLTIAGDTAFTTTAASFSNTGTLTVGAGSTFIAPTLTQISGKTLSGGTFVLGGNIDLSNSGISITTNGSTLTLEGGTINSDGVNALTNLATNSKSLTLAGDANFTTGASVNFSNTGTLTVDSGSTFTVAHTLAQYKSTTNTLSGGTFVVGGTLALAAGANGIETDSSNLTLDGTGTIKNTTSGANANALVNLNTIGSTGSFTLASGANFTTAGNLTNSGKLTVDSGSTLTVTGTLSNLSGGTLTGGTYTVGGTLQLASANGGITTNAATLTLTGTTAKIMDGTSNALSTLANNSGSLTLSAAAKLTTAPSTFTNSGTVDVTKGTTLTVGGTGHSYSQTAGTTTVDGTLSAGAKGTVSLTGGTIQGAGTVVGNTTNTSGTFSAGDAGKAGLLTITGTYTQLSSGTLNVNVGGTTLSTQYSQLKISGTASLGGTLAVTLINSFTPAIGNTFTILTAKSVAGTFTNTTIAINSSEQFDITYTSTGVVLTVVSTPASHSNPPAQSALEVTAADPKHSVGSPSKNTTISAKNTLRHALTGIGKRVDVASLGHGLAPVSGAIYATPRIWEHVPVAPSWDHMKAVTVVQRAENLGGASSDLAHHVDLWTGTSHAVAPIQSPVIGRSGLNNTRRIPVHTLPTALPIIR